MKGYVLQLTKAASSLVWAWHSLSELKFVMYQEQDPEKKIEDAMISIEKDGDSLNLSQIICDLKLGIKGF